MDPTWISAGASLLGGLFGDDGPSPMDTWRNTDAGIHSQIANTRKYAEQYGFNPLSWIGSTSVTQGQPKSNYMGSAIADAGLMLADGLAKKQKGNELLSALEKENKELAQKVQSLTLRPKVGGVYSQRASVPTLRQALGVPDVQPVPNSGLDIPSGVGASPLPTTDFIDPRRKVEDKSIETSAGVLTVDNPYTGRLRFPTLDGDEPIDLLDIPSMMIGTPQLLYNMGGKVRTSRDSKRGSGPVFKSGGQRYQMEKTKPPYRDRKYPAKGSILSYGWPS